MIKEDIENREINSKSERNHEETRIKRTISNSLMYTVSLPFAIIVAYHNTAPDSAFYFFTVIFNLSLACTCSYLSKKNKTIFTGKHK